MKRLKRVGAILMALALIVGLLPVGVFHTHAHAAGETPVVPSVGDNNIYLHAVYVADGVKLNGVHDYTYPLNAALTSDLMIGAAWDLEYLYLAVNSAAELAQLKVNGVNVVVSKVTAATVETTTDEETGEVTSTTVVDPGFAEYRISLLDAGITSLASGVNKVTVQVEGEDAQTLYLIFDNNNYARQKLSTNNTSSATRIELTDSYTAKYVGNSFIMVTMMML